MKMKRFLSMAVAAASLALCVGAVPVSASDTSLKAPLSAEYKLDGKVVGMADGTLTVNLPNDHNADGLFLWWADDSGVLEGYTRLAPVKIPSKSDTTVVYEMTANTFIPPNATRLLIYTYSGTLGISQDFAQVELPKNSAYVIPEDELIAEFQVASDFHYGRNNSANQRVEGMLDEIANNSPDSVALFIAGDLVNTGAKVSEYEGFWALHEGTTVTDNVYVSLGNHECFGWSNENIGQAIATFLDNIILPDEYDSDWDKPYYDVRIGDIYCIVLGGTTRTGDSCSLGDEQYDWLELKLSEVPKDSPVFVILHQGLENTVAGTSTEDGWWGITDPERFHTILDKYPNIIMFNGHSHWAFDTQSDKNMYGGGDEAAIFNTASVRDSYEGYYVQVYKDRVLVRGRNFGTSEWVSSAQFVVNERYTGDKKEDEPSEDKNHVEDNIGEFNPTPATTPSATTTVTEPVKKSGCGSSLSGIGVAFSCLFGGAAVASKKRKK